MSEGTELATAATPRLSRKVVAAFLESIGDDLSRVQPEAVVAICQPEDHPLHSYFEWDDSKAGHLHRLSQARSLIRSVTVVVEVQSMRISSPHYVHDPELPPGEAGYVPVVRLKSRDEVASDALDAEVGRAASALRRARGIAFALNRSDDASRVDAALTSLGYAS